MQGAWALAKALKCLGMQEWLRHGDHLLLLVLENAEAVASGAVMVKLGYCT